MKHLFRNIGPGTLVAAAFIGPGTVTVCTLAGVHYGFELLWAMVLSVVATIILQEMAARLGLVYGKGLAATVKDQTKQPFVRTMAIILMLLAILVGNAAYEAGNISGGILGLETILGGSTIAISGYDVNFVSIAIGVIAFILLYIGNYKVLERSLVALVLLMSFSFLLAAFLTTPNFLEVLKGLIIPTVPNESLLTILGLVGTTVVPYNLFLHANLVKEKWNGSADLKKARTDLYVSILLGGLVSIAIIICGASIQQGEVQNAADLAIGLEPLFGSFSKYMLSVGLFAAGITSAITAPLAAAYVARECFGWGTSLRSKKFRAVWMVVIFLGVLFSSVGIKPIKIIQVAQVANGLLLPIIAGFLLWVVNKESVLGNYKNGRWQNVFGLLIVTAAIILGVKGILKVFY